MMFSTKLRGIVASLAFCAFAVTASASFADEVKLPATQAEHEALATQYKEQAAQYRRIAEEHKAMAAAYADKHQPTNGPTPNAGTTKMKKHCQVIVKDAEKLAADADKAADYHAHRAKELQGT